MLHFSWEVKIKTLLPSLKENIRYFLYEIKSENNIKITKKMIEDELRNFIGELGLAKAGLNFIETNNNKGILKVNAKSLHEIRTGLALINNINNNKVNVKTLKVSGTINKLKREFKEGED